MAEKATVLFCERCGGACLTRLQFQYAFLCRQCYTEAIIMTQKFMRMED